MPDALPEREHPNDVRVFQSSNGFGFEQEPGTLSGIGVLPRNEHLQCDGAVQAGLRGLVHNAKRATTERAFDLEPRHHHETRSGGYSRLFLLWANEWERPFRKNGW